MTTRVCLVLRAHVPWRLRSYNYFDVGRSHDYFDRVEAARRLERADAAWLRPAVEAVDRLLARRPRFAFALAASGPLLAQLETFLPERLADLERLVASGRVEPLGATSHRSVRRALSAAETARQIRLHARLAAATLGRAPRVFGGEEPPEPVVFAETLEAEGFRGMILERGSEPPAGAARRRIYGAGRALGVAVAEVSGEGGRRRTASERGGRPRWLEPGRLASWISAVPGDILAAAMDLSAFGPAGSPAAGVGALLEDAVAGAEGAGASFETPSDVLAAVPAAEPLPARAGAPAGSNELQRDAHARLAALERSVGDAAPDAVEDFRRLTGSDHFAAMSLRPPGAGRSGEEPADPYETYMAFRHAVADLSRRLATPARRPRPAAAASPA